MPYLELFLLFSLLYMADCQTRNHSLPIRLPNAPLSTSCPLRRDPSLVKETLDEYYPPCPCGGVRGWTRAVHLDMSDRNQQCPSNWTLVTTPIRGCGRTNRNQGVCDSVTYPVHGRTYSQVCGRVLAYQKGWPSALYNSLRPSSSFALEEAYLSGVSLTHGPPDSRQHIWSFIAGEYELDDGRFKSFKCPCSTTNWPTKYLHSLTITTFVILEILDPTLILALTTLRILYGMARGVASLARAVNSTLPHGSVYLYLNLPVRTWR